MKKILRVMYFSIIGMIFIYNSINAQIIQNDSTNQEIQRIQKKTIAVLDLQGKGIDESGLSALTNIVMGEILKFNDYELLERSNMEAILKEQGFQQAAGCTDEHCAVEMGQLLGVQYMIFGKVEKLGNLYVASLKLVDVETGKIVKITNREFEGKMEGLILIIKNMTRELLGKPLLDESILEKYKISQNPPKKDTIKIISKEEKPKEYRKYFSIYISTKRFPDLKSNILYPDGETDSSVLSFYFNYLNENTGATEYETITLQYPLYNYPLIKGIGGIGILFYLSKVFAIDVGGYFTSNIANVKYSLVDSLSIKENIGLLNLGLRFDVVPGKNTLFFKFSYLGGLSLLSFIYDYIDSEGNPQNLTVDFSGFNNGFNVESGYEFHLANIGIALSVGYFWIRAINLEGNMSSTQYTLLDKKYGIYYYEWTNETTGKTQRNLSINELWEGPEKENGGNIDHKGIDIGIELKYTIGGYK